MNESPESEDAFPSAGMMRIMDDNFKRMFLCTMSWARGTGKRHLAIPIARSCIRSGACGRFYNVVDLVNRLEAEKVLHLAGAFIV